MGLLLSTRSPSCPDGLADILKFSPGKGPLTPGFESLEGTSTSGSPPLQETPVQDALLVPGGLLDVVLSTLGENRVIVPSSGVYRDRAWTPVFPFRGGEADFQVLLLVG